jgi:hypothetical protein
MDIDLRSEWIRTSHGTLFGKGGSVNRRLRRLWQAGSNSCAFRDRRMQAFRSAEADLVSSRRTHQLLLPMTGGLHGDLGVAVAVPGHFLQAKPMVERLRAAVDREHVEDQVLARALCFLDKGADDPGTDAVALMAGVDFDAGQVDLPGAVLDIQHADVSLPGGDDLPSVRVEGALMKRALDLLVPPPDRRDVLAHGGLVKLVAELGIGGAGRPQGDSRLGQAGLQRPARTLTWHRSGPRSGQ